MTTRSNAHAKKSASNTTTASETTAVIAPATTAASAITPAHPTAHPLSAAPPPAPSTSIAPPPADANIPVVPTTAVPTNGSDFKGVAPKVSEQAALPAALQDLLRFASYPQVLGGAAPPIAQVIALLTLGVQWTGMRNSTAAWDTYCRTQEGFVWAQLRALMLRLKPAWDLAVKADASLASQFPGIASLLGAKKVIAQKALSTKQANKKAIAEGKAPLHGVVGKQRKTSAKNAAYASATATPPAHPAPATGGASPAEPGPVAVPVTGATPTPPSPVSANGSPSPSGAAHA